MSLKSRAALAAILGFVVFSVGCGDTFRPIAIPIIDSGGQPQALREAVILSTGGTAPGSPEGQTTHVNVSGDSNVGQVVVGRDPVHLAIIGNGGTTVVVNRAEESINLYSTLAPTAAQPPIFISLPVGSVPVFAYSNVLGIVYVAESGTNKVAVVSTSVNALTAEVAVGNDPVALVGTPDGTKLFVANRADNTVNVIDPGTNALLATGLPNTITVGAGPSYLAVNTNGSLVFSINTGGNSVSVIDTTTGTAHSPDVPVGGSPNFAYFDAFNNKLWVTNSTGNSVSVINVDVNSPSYLSVATVPLTASCTTPNPVSITVLADGSRAYVADSGCASVSVINTLSNAVTKTIPVGNKPVSIVSSPDSSKVYTANNQSGNISIIQTSNDTVVNTLAAPAGTAPIYAAIAPF